ncbi:hypothetical protein [Actomonas aquatica]|uniref:DoxX family protein n=1 Tax=Actomonas aquatica TaxID=2866162 RepID=A0ABZ1C708_9BACT|nr:hypothetical protein [Opitutus sp. WL0086]WRQ87155.1 hypothetical protein K1X11_020270 [Opitutus sp. WL0086]
MKQSIQLSKGLTVVSWVTRIVAAVILLQTLFFKFSAHPDSVAIFTAVGQEPIGRIGSGIVELIASVMLFVPGLVAVGAALAVGTMSGAIFFHLTSLGVVVNDDGGTLFSLAIVVWVCSAVGLWLYRGTLPVIGPKLVGRTGGVS